jgi:hypothetical protein
MNTWATNTPKLKTRNKGYRLQLGHVGRKSYSSRHARLVHANDQTSGRGFDGQGSFTILLVFFAAAAGISGSAFVWSLL